MTDESLNRHPPAPARPARLRTMQWQSAETNNEGEEGQAWLITYLDTLTLLLTLFVVLLAYSTFKPDHFQQVTAALAQNGTAAGTASQTDQMAHNITEKLTQAGIAEGIKVVSEHQRITLQIQENILFASGQADLNPSGANTLMKLAPLLGSGHLISVEGHTDDIPINTGVYPSNWELSAARAARVVRYLAEQGVPQHKLRAIGYGEMRPVADNATASGRNANRRVNIVLDMLDNDKAGH